MSDGAGEALVRFLFQAEPWMEFAACKDKPKEWFILERGKNSKRGKAVCATCPVTGEDGPCAQYAEKTGSVGIWGGKVFAIKDTEREDTAVDMSPRPLFDARPVPILPPDITHYRRKHVEEQPVQIAARKAV